MEKQGPHEKTIIEQALMRGLPVPDMIRNAPELLPGLDLYFVAFLELSTCRPATMAGVGPIPWTAIDQYAVAGGFTGDQRGTLFYCVRAMERAQFERQQTPKIITP